MCVCIRVSLRACACSCLRSFVCFSKKHRFQILLQQALIRWSCREELISSVTSRQCSHDNGGSCCGCGDCFFSVVAILLLLLLFFWSAELVTSSTYRGGEGLTRPASLCPGSLLKQKATQSHCRLQPTVESLAIDEGHTTSDNRCAGSTTRVFGAQRMVEHFYGSRHRKQDALLV